MKPDFSLGIHLLVTFQQPIAAGFLVRLPDGSTGLVRRRELLGTPTPGEEREALLVGRTAQGMWELSLRLADHDPWRDLVERLYLGQLLTGVVTGVHEYGVFIEIEPGLTGLLHQSAVPAWMAGHLPELFWLGDLVRVRLQALDTTRRRLVLDLTGALTERWPSPSPLICPMPLPRSQAVGVSPWELLAQSPPQRILVVEDDPLQQGWLRAFLEGTGQSVRAAASGEEALRLAGEEGFEWALVDYQLAGRWDGVETIEHLHRSHPDARYILTTGGPLDARAERLLRSLCGRGLFYLPKPLTAAPLSTLLLEPPRQAAPAAPALGGGIRIEAVSTQRPEQALTRLMQLTGAEKALLLAFDPASQHVSCAAQVGDQPLRAPAFAKLAESPVRDVALDGERLLVAELRAPHTKGQLRNLLPLLRFRSVAAVPVPTQLPTPHALFLFHRRPATFDETTLHLAEGTAIALAALLEQDRFVQNMAQMERAVLLGNLSRIYIHESSNQFGALTRMTNDLHHWCQSARRCVADMLPATLDEAATRLAQLACMIEALGDESARYKQLVMRGEEQLERLDTIVENVVALATPSAQRAAVTLEFIPPVHLSFTHAHGSHLHQLLLNLLLNAIQHIEIARGKAGGRVRLGLERIERDSDPWFQITIEDDGPGIHRAHWPRLFHHDFTTRREGSGIGLYLAQALARQGDGHLYLADSAIGWGSAFVLELPDR